MTREEILAEPHTKIPHWLLQSWVYALSIQEEMVLVEFLTWYDYEKQAGAFNYKTLASNYGASVATFIKHTESLEEKGILQITEHVFTINWPVLKELCGADNNAWPSQK